MPEFHQGESYTRAEIHKALGGGVQDYLPHRDGQVVAACLSPQLNPDAPEVVLPGLGPEIQRWAERFAEQRESVPTFLKRGTNDWEYVGNYRVRRLATDPSEINEQRYATGRDDVSMVLYLESAG
jgi:hypothetical protein